ncbi:SIS domain-containing protein [Nonomuraea rosea]|uniref:SIS domain-containing protein n=1 Tax=Nonomuraea rosea TaxID=638574 RepID=UPI003CD0A8D3
MDPACERVPGLAERIYDLARPDPIDPFLIVSNSGVNAAIAEMAHLADLAVSVNLAAGDKGNAPLWERYRSRVRPVEPWWRAELIGEACAFWPQSARWKPVFAVARNFPVT